MFVSGHYMRIFIDTITGVFGVSQVNDHNSMHYFPLLQHRGIYNIISLL